VTGVDVLAPIQQEGTKAAVRSWFAAVGDMVREGDPLVELETDKVAVEVPAPCSGVLTEILIPADQDATPGAVLGRIGAGTAGAQAAGRGQAGSRRADRQRQGRAADPPGCRAGNRPAAGARRNTCRNLHDGGSRPSLARPRRFPPGPA